MSISRNTHNSTLTDRSLYVYLFLSLYLSIDKYMYVFHCTEPRSDPYASQVVIIPGMRVP